MSELKPCPFCGGEARTSLWLDQGVWCATCKSCNALIPYEPIESESGMGSPDKAIAAWNTRAETPAPDRERLRRLLVIANDNIDSTGAFDDERVIDEFLASEGQS